MLSRLWRWIGLALVSMSFILGSSIIYPQIAPTVAEAMELQPPLSTQGAQIVDALGQPVLLRGVNWFGIETETHVPHGLWARDYKDMLKQIRSLNYNLIRLPYSVQALRQSTVEGIDFSIGSNKDLEGKTPLEVMDIIIQEANKQKIFVLLDAHRLNTKNISELWYGEGFTEEDWINTWVMLAERYRNQPNVIGADLKNEPHGRASWGTGDLATDWRLAAERAGNAILKVNPNWLIVVEGVEKNVPGQRLEGHWWGGNLEGARNFPVRLSRLDKLVYSPHEYGSGVADQPWFRSSYFPENLYPRWETGFQYIARLKLAPILVGEFGGRRTSLWTKEGIWQRQFINYLEENKISFAYWSWNPNSADTGGILRDDWRSIHDRKQRLLANLLSEVGFVGRPGAARSQPAASSSLSASQSPDSVARSQRQREADDPALGIGKQPIPTSVPPAENGENEVVPPIVPAPGTAVDTPNSAPLQVKTLIDSDWQDGFCARFQVTNLSQMKAEDWQLSFRMNQAEVNTGWNAGFYRQGTQYTVNPAYWARSIFPGQTIDIGFCANKRGADYQLQEVKIVQHVSGVPQGSTPGTDSAPSPSPSQGTNTKTATRLATATGQLRLETQIDSDWRSGICARFQVTNVGSRRAGAWQLTFRMPAAEITSSWNGSFDRHGAFYTVTPPDWARSIYPEQTVDIGFCAEKRGADYRPTEARLLPL